MVSPKAKRAALEHIRCKYKFSIRRSCWLVGLRQSTFFYKPRSNRTDSEIKERILEIAQSKSRYGRPRVVWYLRFKLGFRDNHKRIARIYRELGLQVYKRPKHKRGARRRPLYAAPTTPNELWAMDFVSDSLSTGRRFRLLTVKDLFTHEALMIYVDRSIPGWRVAELLHSLKTKRGLPKAILCDNGPEFVSQALDIWALSNKVELKFIEPGKPTQNAFIESFNGKLRAECLDENWFENLNEARVVIEHWRCEYNEERPNTPLGNRTPREVAQKYGLAI